ncbi:MAG: ATP-binding protein, partial [Verrucomicrobiota bacterium]|nr:ATP-binding protein [Verrucomicrobiota bacterium]
FSKGGISKRESVELSEMIKSEVEFVLHNTGIEKELTLQEPLYANIDKDKMIQAIDNMLINAKDAMVHTQGKLSIEMKKVSLDPSAFNGCQDTDYIKIDISDNGTGILGENQKRIFDPFFTTEITRTGIGLSITYSVIAKHQGYIEVQSEDGKGTTFTIFLPTEAPEKSGVNLEAKEAPKKRILILDDEKAILNLLDAILSPIGCDVDCFQLGKDAIQSYRKHLNSETAYDIVILDLSIPGSLGGIATMKAIKKLDTNAIVYLSSGYSNSDAMKEYKKLDFTGILVKPYTRQELLETIGLKSLV